MCLTVNGGILLLARSISMTLLMLTKWEYALVFSAGDIAVFLMLKVLRGEFWHWIPLKPGSKTHVRQEAPLKQRAAVKARTQKKLRSPPPPLQIASSYLIRSSTKLLTSFTGIVQLRGPGEVGGAFWFFDQIVSVLFPFAAVAIYYAELRGGACRSGCQEVMDERIAWSIVSVLSWTWLGVSAVFFSLIKKKCVPTLTRPRTWRPPTFDRLPRERSTNPPSRRYLGTFFSTQTAPEWAQAFFTEGTRDDIRLKPLR